MYMCIRVQVHIRVHFSLNFWDQPCKNTIQKTPKNYANYILMKIFHTNKESDNTSCKRPSQLTIQEYDVSPSCLCSSPSYSPRTVNMGTFDVVHAPSPASGMDEVLMMNPVGVVLFARSFASKWIGSYTGIYY